MKRAAMTVITMLSLAGMLQAQVGIGEAKEPIPQDPPKEAESAPGITLELYDIQDLTYGIQDFPGIDPNLSLEHSSHDPGPGPAATFQDHVVPILKSMLPGTSGVEFENGRLIVRGTSADHGIVRTLLSAARKSRFTMFEIEAVLLESEVDLSGGKAGKHGAVISLQSEERELLLEGARKVETAKVMQSPKLTVLNGQLSNIRVCQQMAYVQRYDYLLNRAAQFIADPIVGVATFGFLMEIRPVLLDEGTEEAMLQGIRIEISEPAGGAPDKRKIETSAGIVEDLGVRSSTYRFDHRIRKGETLLVGPLSGPWKREGPKQWILLSTRMIQPTEEGKPEGK